MVLENRVVAAAYFEFETSQNKHKRGPLHLEKETRYYYFDFFIVKAWKLDIVKPH